MIEIFRSQEYAGETGYVMVDMTPEGFAASSLPLKGWVYPAPEKIFVEDVYVPFSVTMRQARLALLQAGLLDTVSQAVSSIGGAAEIEWEYGSEVQRDNPLIGMVASQAGMTMEQIDQLFIAASQL